METLALFFAFSICVLAIPTHSAVNPIRLPTAKKAVGSQSAVVDSDGDEVQPGVDYYINSISWGAAGRTVRLGWLDSTSKCPSDVIVTGRPSFFNNGHPVKITPADSAAATVLSGTHQSITFSVATNKLCLDNIVWGVRYDSQSGQYFLTSNVFFDLFKIEYVPTFKAYKMTYCPLPTDKCYDVGIYYDKASSSERLALTDNKPFIFYFDKAFTV